MVNRSLLNVNNVPAIIAVRYSHRKQVLKIIILSTSIYLTFSFPGQERGRKKGGADEGQVHRSHPLNTELTHQGQEVVNRAPISAQLKRNINSSSGNTQLLISYRVTSVHPFVFCFFFCLEPEQILERRSSVTAAVGFVQNSGSFRARRALNTGLHIPKAYTS